MSINGETGVKTAIGSEKVPNRV